MNIKYNTLSIIIMLSLVSPFSYADTKTCNTSNIIKKIEQRLDEMTDYQVTITATVNTQQPTEMIIASKRPDLLKAIVKLSDTDKLTIVYDKKYQWIEEGNTVYQIDLSKDKKRSDDRPFDTEYSLAGGLLSGEDYIGTIKTMLNIYDLKASCQANTITLKGNLNTAKFTDYTKDRHINVPINDFVKQFEQTLKTATMTVDRKNDLVTDYTLTGTDRFKVLFSNYDFNALTAEQLDYKLPAGVKPIDLTSGSPSSEPAPATDDDAN